MASPVLQLPLDFFREIRPYITSHLLGKLWLCGNGALNTILSRPGVVEHLRVDYGPGDKLCWPKLISSFPYIDSLVVKVHRDNKHPAFLDFDLDLLPSSLGHLSIEFPWNFERTAVEALFSAPVSVDLASCFPKMDYLLVESLGIFFVPIQLPHFDLILPPCLKRLVLITGVSFPSSMLELLPETLERLTIYVHLADGAESIPPLPRGLLLFSVLGLLPAIVLPALPPGLTDLHLYEKTGFAQSNPDWSLLPTTLTSMTAPVHFDEAFVKALPRGLTELNHNGLAITDYKLVEHLPRGLRIWDTPRMGGFIREMPALIEFLSLLPPSLEMLPELFYMRVELSHRPTLPKGLRRLAASANVPGPFPASVDCLPTGLVRLDIRGLDSSYLASLPPRLESLNCIVHVKSGNEKDFDPLAACRAYPLKTLVMSISSDNPYPESQKIAFEGLSPTLRRFDLRFPHYDVQDIDWTLPWSKSLEKIELTPSHPILDSDRWFSTLPRALLEVNLSGGPQFVVDLDRCLPHLPPGLTRLIIRKVTVISDEHLDMLPQQQLKELTFDSALPGTFTACGLQRLPLSVLYLTLPRTDGILPDEIFPRLHRRMNHYRIGDRYFSN